MILPVKINDWPSEWRELWQERAAIMEIEGHQRRTEAERDAERDIRKIARQETERNLRLREKAAK